VVDAGWITRVLCKVSWLAGYSHSFFKEVVSFCESKKEKKRLKIKNPSLARLRSAIRYIVTWGGEVGVGSGTRVGSGQADLLCITNISKMRS